MAREGGGTRSAPARRAAHGLSPRRSGRADGLSPRRSGRGDSMNGSGAARAAGAGGRGPLPFLYLPTSSARWG